MRWLFIFLFSTLFATTEIAFDCFPVISLGGAGIVRQVWTEDWVDDYLRQIFQRDAVKYYNDMGWRLSYSQAQDGYRGRVSHLFSHGWARGSFLERGSTVYHSTSASLHRMRQWRRVAYGVGIIGRNVIFGARLKWDYQRFSSADYLVHRSRLIGYGMGVGALVEWEISPNWAIGSEMGLLIDYVDTRLRVSGDLIGPTRIRGSGLAGSGDASLHLQFAYQTPSLLMHARVGAYAEALGPTYGAVSIVQWPFVLDGLALGGFFVQAGVDY